MKRHLFQLLVELRVCLSRGATFADRLRLVRDTARFHIGNRLRSRRDLGHPCHYGFRVGPCTVDIQMRPHAGDFFVLHEVFGSRCYAIPAEWRGAIRTVLDLGAHVGLTALYLLESIPNAHVVCVEAAADNAALLRENLSSFGDRVTVVEAAIGPRSGRVAFDSDGWSWQRRVRDDNACDRPVTVACQSIEDVMRGAGMETIDLLKIDVEGAESAIFAQPGAWLSKVRTIIIEIHAPYSYERFSDDMMAAGFRVITPHEDLGNQMIMATRHPSDSVKPSGTAC